MKVSAMKTYKDFIIYKGQDKEVQIPFAVSGFTDFTASFYTDKQYEVLKGADDFDFDGEWASIFFDNTDLDLLNDGVLRYTFNYKIDGVDVVKSTNSAYTLRTPENYSARTGDVIYEEGYSSGYTDGMVSGTSVGYEEGFEEGEETQKAKMTGVTITENGLYTRPDGYSSVDVTVDQVGPYNSGYTSGYTDGVQIGQQQGREYAQWEVESDAVGLDITENGHYPAPTSGLAGWVSAVTVTVDQSAGYQSGYTNGYNEGNEYGYDRARSKFEQGKVGLTVSGNGHYDANVNYYELSGWISAVTVNVPSGLIINWNTYEDNTYNYIKLNIANVSGDILCSIGTEENNIILAVTVANGHITNYRPYNYILSEIANDIGAGVQETNGVMYFGYVFVDSGYLYMWSKHFFRAVDMYGTTGGDFVATNFSLILPH